VKDYQGPKSPETEMTAHLIIVGQYWMVHDAHSVALKSAISAYNAYSFSTTRGRVPAMASTGDPIKRGANYGPLVKCGPADVRTING